MSKTPLPLEYAPPVHRPLIVPFWVSVLVVTGAIAAATYVAVYFRTMGWGFHLRGFLGLSAIFLLCAVPFVVFSCWGRRVRTTLLCVLAVLVVPHVIAEVWAGAQEQLFVLRSRRTPGMAMSENRWWFKNHHIGTDGKGIYYGND